MTKRISTDERDEAIKWLRRTLRPGQTVWTILRHVARSGMFRRISVLTFRKGEPVYLDHPVELAVMGKPASQDGITIDGAGEDKGFALVYGLASQLWPNGFTCPGKRCPSSDHTNGDRNYRPHHHKGGGFALRQRWL